jgi:hypothetical protein
VSEVVRNFTSCRTANELFEEFAEATQEHFEATEDLSMLIGCHEAFAEALKVVNEKRLTSCAACRALERHWEEHGCRAHQRDDPVGGQPTLSKRTQRK